MAAPPPVFNQLPPPRNAYPYENFTYRFNASMAIIVVVLVTTFFFMALFVLYIRRCNMINTGVWIHNLNNANANANQQQGQPQRNQGLDQEALANLPIMRYSSIKLAKKSKAGPECAVCLLQFDDVENVRLLPSCGHLFHTECIDMWLESHSTCPLCRSSLDPKAAPAGSLQRAMSAVVRSFRRDPNSSSIRSVDEGPEVVGGGGDERAHVDVEAGGGEEAEVNASRRQQGEVVRALSLHSESFRDAVHDMDLLEVREKLRARSIRAAPPAAPPVVMIHHSKSFAGLVLPPHDDHDEEQRDEFSPSNNHQGLRVSPNVGLRRSASDGDHVSRGLWTGETSSRDTGGGKPVFTGFARKSLRRSWKWLVGGGSSAAPGDSNKNVKDQV